MSEAPATRRLFFALWPDEAVRAQLAQAARQWSQRPVPAANLHLTLAFLGACDEAQLACLYRAAPAVRGEPFTLQLDYLGNWSRSRTLWLGTSRIPDALLRLVEALRQAIGPCVALDGRRFVPHVTLSRKEKDPPVRAGLEAIHWTVEDFVLAESVSTPDGVRYDVLRRWPLGAPAARQ